MRVIAERVPATPADQAEAPTPSQPTLRYRMWRRLAQLLLSVADVNVTGAERFPATGPYVLAINHLSLLDTVVAFAVVPHQFAGIVAQSWADRPVTGLVMRAVTMLFPVDMERTNPRVLAQAVRWLRDGGVLLIAPEGGISRSGALRHGNPGAAFIAARVGTPVVPLAMWGQERARSDLLRLRRPRIHAAVGEPLELAPQPKRPTDDDLEAMTDSIMQSLAALLPAPYRGVYGTEDPLGP
jgi:1-acyl-sn-glycerol-3-phosphate acyltransferase